MLWVCERSAFKKVLDWLGGGGVQGIVLVVLNGGGGGEGDRGALLDAHNVSFFHLFVGAEVEGGVLFRVWLPPLHTRV